MTDHHAKGFLGAVGRFFFAPTDPSTLGFMRIMAGLLLLYTHGAYSLDLKALLGPHAWWDHQAANTQRREAPYIPTPLGWSEFWPTLARMDDAPHRRAAEIEFFRNLPSESAARKEKVRYLGRLFALPPADVRDGLFLINSATRLNTEQVGQVRGLLAQSEVPEMGSPVGIPEFLRRLPPPERLRVWDELHAFTSALPDEPEKQEYILTWLGYYPHDKKQDLYKFLAGELSIDGRDMSLPADPGERAEFLEFLERWGGDTRQARTKGTAVFSQWLHLTDGTTMWIVHFVGLFVLVLFTIGLWTRTTSVLAWVVSLTYIHRGQLSLFGQDTMQTILVTYLMIGPCGAAFSIDALRKRFRASRALMTAGVRPAAWAQATLAGPQASWLANFAIRLLQINYCFIYASSGLSKLKGVTWWEHSAAWLVLANPEFGPVRYRAYEWMLHQLVEYRLFITIIAASVSVFTLVVELGLPVLIWTRLRPLFVISSVLLHLGIAIIMGLNMFGLYMFALLLCYFPARLIRDRVGYGPGLGAKMTVQFDSSSPAAVRKAALVRAFDVAQQITFVEKTGTGNTISLTGPDGRQATGQELYKTALQQMVLLKPVRLLGWIPGLWPCLNWWGNRA